MELRTQNILIHFHSLAFYSDRILGACVCARCYKRRYTDGSELFVFLENIKKRVNGFLSIPHFMQRYRDCTIWREWFLILRIFFSGMVSWMKLLKIEIGDFWRFAALSMTKDIKFEMMNVEFSWNKIYQIFWSENFNSKILIKLNLIEGLAIFLSVDQFSIANIQS